MRVLFSLFVIFICVTAPAKASEENAFKPFFRKFYALIRDCSAEAKQHIRFPLQRIAVYPAEDTERKILVRSPNDFEVCSIIGGNGTQLSPKTKIYKIKAIVTINYTNSEFEYIWRFDNIKGKWLLTSVTESVY